MSKKVYARQINPMYQGDLIGDVFGFDEYYNDISVCGNRDYHERTTEVFTRVFETLSSGDLAEAIANAGESYSWYSTATEAINDYLYREDGKNYSCKDIHDLKQLIKQYSECHRSEENDIICKVLSIVTRQEYDYTMISGYCQGDWNEVFYPVEEYSREDIRTFETLYFNKGSEWIIHDEDGDPESAEDINGFSHYCTTNDVRKEIAIMEGVSPEDVVLYEYHESMQPYYIAV